MTEKARKIWLEIGDKWNNFALGKDRTNTTRDMYIHITLWTFTLAMAIAGKKKMAMGGILTTLVVVLLDQAGCDSLTEELLEELRACSARCETILKNYK